MLIFIPQINQWHLNFLLVKVVDQQFLKNYFAAAIRKIDQSKHWIKLKAIFKVRHVQNFLSGSMILNEVLVWSNQLSYFQKAFRLLEIHTLPSFLLLNPWFFLLWSCRKHKITEINHSWTNFLNTLFHQPAHEIISPTEHCLR